MQSDSGEDFPDLVDRTRRGARLGAANVVLTQVGSVIATILLARLLSPAEFGIIAIAQSLLGAAKLFSVSGVRASIVTRSGPVKEVADTLFWTTVGFAGLVWIIVAVAAKPLTELLGQPNAAPYVIVLAGAFFANLLSHVPLGLLQRSMRFRAYYAASLAGVVVYFVSEVVLALLGFGAWSVIVGQVLDGVTTLVLAFVLSRWFPRLRFSRKLLREESGFLGGVTLNWGLAYVQRNADFWAVSAVLGGPILGTYYIAYVLPNIVRQRLTVITTSVLLPAYRSVQHDQARMERAWQRSWLVQAGLGIPGLLGIAALAGPIVAVFFGPQWTATVVPLQILTLVALVDVHMATVGVMAVARRRVMWNSVVLGVRAALTTVLAFVAAVTYETVTAVAWAVAIAALVSLVVQESTVSRYLGVGLRPILRPLGAYAGLGLLMATAVSAFVQLTPSWPALVQLVVGVMIGLAVYLGIGWLVAGPHIRPLIRESHALLRGR